MTAFGALLVQRGITSDALAEAMGYSEPAVRSWRDGQRLPSKGARVMLLRHLPDLDDERLLALLTSPPPPDWLTARLVEHALTRWRLSQFAEQFADKLVVSRKEQDAQRAKRANGAKVLP